MQKKLKKEFPHAYDKIELLKNYETETYFKTIDKA